ncbi:MAG: glutathione S-transferase family protein, partial [Burkholderiales bacterium]
MLTLYFSPGACSMASHIGLEETGAPYEEKPVLLPKGEHKTDAYLKINPRGKVPALSVDGKVITENTAILTYLAKRFPDKNLLPADPVEEARCISTMAWFSNSVHPHYTHYLRPERYADGEAAQAAVKVTAKQTFLAQCSEIDSLLKNKQWIMGDQYTVADPYALVF